MQAVLKNKLIFLRYCISRVCSENCVVIYLKHIASSVCRKRYFATFLALTSICGLIFYVLLSWGVICSNVEVWQHVHKICHQHRDGEAIGNLCPPLCEYGRIHSMNCQPLHAGKEIVFKAVLDGMPLVFKSTKRLTTDTRTTVFTTDDNGNQYFPSEDEFYNLISSLITNKLNFTANKEQIEKLMHLGPVPIRSELRHTEMKNLWSLLQDHEYLSVRLFSEQEIFPTLIGSCGEYYATEYAEPLSGGALWEHEDDTWSERLRSAVLMLELVERLESTLTVPLRVCDVRLQHFGKSFDGTKIVILDGDSVVTKDLANTLSGDNTPCVDHKFCHFFDCHAACEDGYCVPPSTNNNLQTICEKVFLGEHLAGVLLMPGLLASPHASPALTTLLRLCAHPHGEEGIKYGTPDDVRDRLVATVEEMLNDLDLQAI